jgi:hypothetical protein
VKKEPAFKLGVVTDLFIPNIQGTEAGESQVQNQAKLHS